MSSSSSTSSSGEDSTTIIFWESLTGQQFNIPVLQSRPFSVSYGTGRKDDLHAHDSSSLFPTHPFNHIYAMFRHDRMAINLQTRPGLSSATSLNDGSNIDNRACFDLTDSRYWACFSNPEHAMLKHPGSSLLPSLIAQSGSSNLQQQQSATLSPSFLLEPEPVLRERSSHTYINANIQYIHVVPQLLFQLLISIDSHTSTYMH